MVSPIMSYPLAINLAPGTETYMLALDIVVIGIVLAALALGISKALSSRKLWAWGAEELAQALINAAILGILVAWGAGVGAALGAALPADMLSACPQADSSANAPLAYDLCVLNGTVGTMQRAQGALIDNSFRLGMLSSMTVNLNVLSATPFEAMDRPAAQYSDWAGQISSLQALVEAHRQLLSVIGSYAFVLFLPLGLLLRMFFATRKLGGALLAGAIGFFVIYPLAYASLANPGMVNGTADDALASLGAMSQTLAPLPQFDWDKSGDMAKLVTGLSNQNLSAQAAMPYGSMPAFLGALILHAIVYPLVALAITLVSVWELSALLGREMFFEVLKEA